MKLVLAMSHTGMALQGITTCCHPLACMIHWWNGASLNSQGAGAPAAPGKPKRWWETDKGKENIKHAAGPGRRAADNTYVIEREPDDFERLNLLDPANDRSAPSFTCEELLEACPSNGLLV